MRRVDILGKKFGNLTVIGEEVKRNKHTYIKCLCDCGKEHIADKYRLISGETKYCSSCSFERRPKASTHHQWTGCGEISGEFWGMHILRNTVDSTISRKNRKPKEISITIDYVWDLFLKQNRKCALSGMELRFPKGWKDQTYTASLDRIDSNIGYIPGNVQWVHKHINMMKRTYPQDYFIQMCKEVAKFSSGKCEINV